MIVFLNGAFGIGKTTVARRLRRRLPRSVIFDPERVGFVLQRLPRWIPLDGRGTGDFQDLPAWRRGALRGIALARRFRPTVIVPMAFTNLAYLDEIRSGARRVDPDVRHFCLTAPLEVVERRLEARGGVTGWQRRRAAECCAVHEAPAFAEQIATEHLTADAVAAAIAARLHGGAPEEVAVAARGLG